MRINKFKSQGKGNNSFLWLAFSFGTTFYLIISCISVSGQEAIPIPLSEKFRKHDGIISIDTRGVGISSKSRSFYEDSVRIYNSDGSIWYEFSHSEKHPLYYKRNPKIEFKPYTPLDEYPLAVRVKAVSEHWYEVVVVNNDTKKTKFTRVNDNFLHHQSFETIIVTFSRLIKFNKQKNPLRKLPNGKLELNQPLDSDLFEPIQIKGDWLEVRIIDTLPNNDRSGFGWIRWKNGRDILVCFKLNQKNCQLN